MRLPMDPSVVRKEAEAVRELPESVLVSVTRESPVGSAAREQDSPCFLKSQPPF